MTRTIAVLAASLALAGSASGGSRGFSAHVTNPWFPLKPGTVYTYQGVKDGKPSREVPLRKTIGAGETAGETFGLEEAA